jgi:hypothetical protein
MIDIEDEPQHFVVEEEKPKKKRKKRTYKPSINMSSKTAKYFKAHVLEGMTKKDAMEKAGVKTLTNTTNIERTKTFQALQAKYADTIQKVISMEEVAFEHTKNIIQDQDKGAKNTAIKMFLERVEPDVQKLEDDDKLIIVLRK